MKFRKTPVPVSQPAASGLRVEGEREVGVIARLLPKTGHRSVFTAVVFRGAEVCSAVLTV